MGSQGPGEVEVEVGLDGEVGTIVEEGVRGELALPVVFVVVRVVRLGELGSTLSMLE